MTTRSVLRLALAAVLASASLAFAETTYLPGAAEVSGLAGARFSSTLDLTNAGSAGTTVTIGLVPMAGKPAPAPVTRTLAAGESLRIPSALKTLFGLADGAAGTITVSSADALLASLSTQNVAAPEGAYGLGLLPVPETDLLGAGETGHAIWVSQSADTSTGYRTNLSVTLADAGSVVEVRVFDAEGHLAGTATVTAETPSVWQQPASALVGTVNLPVGRAEFEVKAGRATAYAVVNDNVTSDAIALQSERVVPGATDKLVSGAALSPGQLGSFWSTDLRLFNPGSEAVEAMILSVGTAATAATNVLVPAKGVVELARVLALLGFPEGTACALRVKGHSSLLVAARTNNVDPTGIRKGTFSAQQFVTSWPAGLLGTGAIGLFNGIDQTMNVPGVRTNLTIVGGPDGASGELVLRDAAGVERGRTSFSSSPAQWSQKSVADWFGASASSLEGLAAATVPENARIDVAVGTGALDAFVSRIDNGSGDAVTRPVALPAGGDCAKLAIGSFGAAPQPVKTGVEITFSWTVSVDPPTAELTSQSIRFDGEAEIELGKDARRYVRTFSATGARSATLTVRKGSCVKTRSLSFFACGELTVAPATLPDGVAFAAYAAQQLAVPGATAPTTFAVTSGALPDGLTLSASGELSGKPVETGSFTFTVSATDANGCVGTRGYTIRVFCGNLKISPATLPAGTVGAPYTTVRFTVAGGSGSGDWSATGLPPGLTLSASGQLSGTPTTAGSYAVTVRYEDSTGCVGTATYTVTVCNTLDVGPTSLPAATAGVAYGPATFSVSGASGAATWSVTAGALPAGVALDASTGALSGTPTVVGSFPFTVTATDTLGCRGSAAVTLVVNCPTIAVSPASLSGGTAGVAYVPATLTQTGAVGAVAWSVTAGALPAGLSLSPAGVLSGTPTVVGAFNSTATATDANGCTGSRPYSLTIACPTITLGPLVPATGTAGVAYSATLSQAGGVGAVTYAVTAGALPAGVSLLPTGALTGTPLVTGPFSFTVTATDANGCTGTQGYTLTIACPTIAVSPASVAAGTAGVAYAPVTFTQTGGVGTITWSVIGTLPNAMSLDPGTGILSGTPLQTGSFPVTVRATDVNGCVGDRAIVLTVACPTITVGPASVPSGIAGVVYPGAAFTQTGGVGAITWSVTGALPSGMSLDPGTGVLSGTPLQTGSFPITIRATDANSCFGERAVTLTIQCPTITVGASGPISGVEGSAITPVTFTQSGGVGGIAWSSAGTLPSGLTFSLAGVLSGIPDAGSAGSYTVTFIATDANGCTGSTQVTFRICPVVTVGPNPIAAFLQGVGYLDTLAGSGGAAPYTFAVSAGTLPAGIALDPSTGVLSGNPTTLQAYSFTITATDANGCTGSRPYTGRVCPVITVTTNLPNGVVGAAYSQAFAASGSPDLPYAFSLTGGALPDGLNVVAGALTGTPTTAGTFTFTITATDANGCTGSRTYVVEVCVAPSITPTPAAVCALSAGNTASGPAGATTYSWSIANGTITSGASSQTVTYTAGASGNVTLTLTVSSASSCTASTSVDVPINALPATPAITGVPAGGVCADSTGNTASGPAGATTYAWSITGGTITSATNLQTVTYTAGSSGSVSLTLVVTNASGCSASNSTTAAINANPATPAITGVPAGGVCANSTGNTATGPAGATTYAWSITGGTITSATNLQTVTYTAGSSGNVQLTLVVTNASGCSASNSTTAAVNANPATPTITGVPAGGVCADSTGNTASGPAGATTYAWSITGGTITSATNLQTVTYTAGASGSVNLTLVVTNASGCSTSNSTTTAINANPATPAITGVPAGGVCANSTGNTATGPAGATTYAWSITGGTITSATNLQTVTYTAGASGNVQLTLAVTNASGCSASNSTTTAINANPTTPTITTPTASVCTASPGNTASGPAGATTYAWSITGGTITSASNLQSVTYTAAASGNVQLTLVVTNASGCSATNSLVVPIDPLPTLSPATGTSFTGTFGTLFSQSFTASGGTGPFTYTISPSTPPAGLTFAAGTLSGTPNATGTFAFTVTATSAVGCASTTQSYTLVVRPNLVADSYSGVGNTQLYVTGVAGAPTTPAVASGTTAVGNDTPAAGVTVTGVVSPCVGLGGAITIDSAGRFVYTPPVGSTGNDVCTYTATSDTGGTGTPASATATITIGLASRVWYVNGAAGAGDGRSNSPFNTLASASTAHASNDVVFVQSGGTPTSTPGAITMKATTWLWGQGAALPTVGGITIQNTGATTKPSLTGTVTLGGSSVTVSSLDIATSGSTGLTDDQAGAITGITVQNNVTVTATNAAAVVLSDVTASASGMLFTSLNSSGSGTRGVSLTNLAGTFTASGGSITNATNEDFLVSGGAGNVTYAGTITDDVGVLVAVTGTNGGTKLFSGAISDGNDGDGSGIVLTTNPGTTITFSGGLVLSTGGNPAFTATGGGTLNVCDENPCGASGSNGGLVNTLTTTTGTALNVANTTIGASNLEFQRISSNGGSNTGIILDTTGSTGGLKVKGTGSAGSGGTIANKTGADGSTTTGVGIYLNATANVSLSWMQLNDFENSGIAGRSVTNFELLSSVLNGVIGNSTAQVEGPIAFGTSNPGGTNGLQGTGLIRDTKVRGGVEHNLEFYNQSGSMNLTIEGTTAPGTTSGACEVRNNSVAGGADGIQIEMQGSATATIAVRQCFFDDNKSQPVQAAANDSSAIDIRIEDSVVRRTSQGNEGFILSNGSNGDLTAHVLRNNIAGIGGAAIFVGQTPGNATASSSLTAVIQGNVIDHPTTATNSAILAWFTSTVGQVAPANVLIDGNTITERSTGGVSRGIFVDTPDVNTTPGFTATVTNNSVSVHDNVLAVNGIAAQARRGTGCFDIRNNAVTYPNGIPVGVLGLRLRQAAPGAANLEQGGSAGTAAVVLAANNPASTTEVLGTVTVVGNNSCSPPPS